MPFGWNMSCAKTDLLWVIGADTVISFFSAWAHETFLIWLSHVIIYLSLNTLKMILMFCKMDYTNNYSCNLESKEVLLLFIRDGLFVEGIRNRLIIISFDD